MNIYYLDEEEDPHICGTIIPNRSFLFVAPENVNTEKEWWDFLEDKELEKEEYVPISKKELRKLIDSLRNNKSLTKDAGQGHGLWIDDNGSTFTRTN